MQNFVNFVVKKEIYNPKPMLTTKDTKIFTKDTKRTCLCLPVACLLQAGQTGITENEIAHKVTGLAIIKSVEA